MKGRTPTKREREWLNAITDLGCIVCRLFVGTRSEASPHHIDGKTKPEAHMKTIPLCFLHHQAGSDNEAYTSRHPYKARFEARYGSEESLLAETRRVLEAPNAGSQQRAERTSAATTCSASAEKEE